MDQDNVIGVIGGMGPYAGLDLVEKIFDQTQAVTDQEHLPVALLSYPERIDDRSAFLFGRSQTNPALAIAAILRRLEGAGAVVAGMPCNTAHAAPIYGCILEDLARTGHRIRLLHLIEETVGFVRATWPELGRIGVLSTVAVHHFRLYRDALERAGLEAVVPEAAVREQVVNPAIFDPAFGIKAQGNPPTARARQNLLDAIQHVKAAGAEAVILGCTELPLAVPEPTVDGLPMIDPAVALARALIQATYPEKLRPLG
jgi:aspartate racemase